MIIKSTKLPGGYFRVVLTNAEEKSFEMTVQIKTEIEAIETMIKYYKEFLND